MHNNKSDKFVKRGIIQQTYLYSLVNLLENHSIIENWAKRKKTVQIHENRPFGQQQTHVHHADADVSMAQVLFEKFS